MKIIGMTEDGFILEASKDDVTAMEGMYSFERRFEIGDVVNIRGLFERYRGVSAALEDIADVKEQAERLIEHVKWVEKFRNNE